MCSLTVPLDPPPARNRARDRRARSRRPSRGAVLHPARRGDRAVDGRAHRRSGAPPDPRHRPHRARRLRRAHRRQVGRRAAAAGRRLQQHGRELKAQRDAARAHAPPRGVGRDGAPGRARDQESADADPALRRAPAARARRPRRAARPGARRAASPRSSAQVRLLRQISAEFSQLRLVAHGAPRAGPICRSSSPRSSIRTAPASPDASRSTTACRRRCRRCSSTARSSRARCRTSSRTRCTRCPAQGTLTIDARPRTARGRVST